MGCHLKTMTTATSRLSQDRREPGERQTTKVHELARSNRHCKRDRFADVVRKIVFIDKLIEIGEDRAEECQSIDGCEILGIRRDALDRHCDQKGVKAKGLEQPSLAHNLNRSERRPWV